MPPRVTYWTGVWDPEKEAVSKEINALRTGPRSRAPVVAFAPGQSFRLNRGDRTLVLSARSWIALRGVAALVEGRADVTHIFGARFSWHLFRSLGRRPILLTAVTSHTGPADIPAELAHVAVESEPDVGEWLAAGFSRDRISVIRPGVDLDHFQEMAAPSGRFTLLFASTPSDPREIESRGIPLLVQLARLRPDIDIVVPWRQWGDVGEGRRHVDALAAPANFKVSHEPVSDMRAWFARAHATVVAFAPGSGKSCPSFVIEGFAAGRPCLSTPGGLSSLIENRAGVVRDRTAPALAQAVDEFRSGWPTYAAGARRLAQDEFNVRVFRERYEELYRRTRYVAATITSGLDRH